MGMIISTNIIVDDESDVEFQIEWCDNNGQKNYHNDWWWSGQKVKIDSGERNSKHKKFGKLFCCFEWNIA